MLNNFKHFIVCLVAIIAAQSAWAGQEPSRCPDIQDIARVGVSHAVNYNTTYWAVIEKKNSYGTNRDWSFFIEGLQFTDHTAQQVLTKLNAMLSSFVLTDSGFNDDAEKSWYCVYEHDSENMMGFAVTPVLVVADAGSFAKFLKQH